MAKKHDRQEQADLSCRKGCHLHSGGSLLPQLGQLLVPLLNLLIQALVLNLQLLKVYQVQPLCQLLLSHHHTYMTVQLTTYSHHCSTVLSVAVPPVL